MKFSHRSMFLVQRFQPRYLCSLRCEARLSLVTTLCLQLTHTEKVRVTQRRERNKKAAAKCRQRRVDETNGLLEVYVVVIVISV